MKVGSLGIFNTAGTGIPNSADSKGIQAGFGAILTSTLSGKLPAMTDGQNQVFLSDQELKDLVNYLNVMDLGELEEGMQLLGNIDPDPKNLLSQALSHLGISKDEIEQLLAKWSLLTESETSEFSANDLVNPLLAFVAKLSDLPEKDLATKLGKEEMQAIKAMKLFELLSKYSSTEGIVKDSAIKESFKLLTSKLEVLQGIKFPTEHVQARITRLAAELNLSNKKTFEGFSNFDAERSIKTDGAGAAIPFLPHMARAEQMTVMLQNPDKQVSAEHLMKQFESILSRSQFMNSGGTQKLFIKLYPEHLGSLRIELLQKDQTMIARIITTNSTAKETLESQINGLKQAFATQNITVDKIEVTQQTQQQERFLNRDSKDHHNNQPEEKGKDKQEDSEGFSISLEEALLNAHA